MPVEPNDYALVIGIDDYPNYGELGRPLRGAIRDAKAVHKWLLDQTIGGGLHDENCKLVVSSLAVVDPPQPRKSQIDDALEQIWQMSNKRENETGERPRRFYFYFSGHGQAQYNDDVALCMSNWAKNRQAAALSFRQYLSFVVKCMRFREVVVLMDCCRSRKIGARGQESELDCAMSHDASGQTEIFVAHATEFQTSAFEAETGAADNGEPIVRGHFTEALLAALYGGAARDTGGVPASGLWTYLDTFVPRIAKRHQHDQKPKIEPFGIPPGAPNEPIFGAAQRQQTVQVKITFTPDRQGEIKLEGPTLVLIRQGNAAAGPWEEALPLGTYLLTDLVTGHSKDLHLQPGFGEFDVEF